MHLYYDAQSELQSTGNEFWGRMAEAGRDAHLASTKNHKMSDLPGRVIMYAVPGLVTGSAWGFRNPCGISLSDG